MNNYLFKFPTIWTDEKQSWDESEMKVRRESRRREEKRRKKKVNNEKVRESQRKSKKKMQACEKVGKSRNSVFSNNLRLRKVEK